MATIRELRALFTAEAKGINKAFQSIEQQAGRLGPATQRTTDQVNRNYEAVMTSVRELGRVMESTDGSESFDELNQAAERAQREITETGDVSREAMEELERAVQSGSRRLEGLGDDARSSFSEVERAVQQASDQIEDIGSGGLDDLADSADNANESLDNIGGSGGSMAGIIASAGLLGPVGVAIGTIATGLLGAVVAGDKLQGSLNKLQAQTGASAEEMVGMEESIRNIYGNNFGEGFEDIADSMALVRQNTNLSGDALESMTTDALTLRDTFDYDVAESVKAASTLMKNFGITSEEAYELIAEGSQKGLNYADDLMDTIGEYSVYYEAAGFSAEEMFSMFKNAQETGAFNLDYAADAFKEFGIIMTEEGEGATDVLSSIGLPAAQLQKDFAAGGDTAKAAFQTIAEKLGSIKDPLDRNAAGVALFGTKFEDLGAEAVIAMSQTTNAITGTSGAMDQINAVRYDTIGETITGLGRAFVTDILLPIQDRVMPTINKFADMILTAGDALRAFLAGDETVEDVLMSYGLDPQNFQAVITAIKTMQEVFSRLRENALPVLKEVGSAILNGLVKVWTFVQPALSAAVSFIGVQVGKIAAFWNENGAQIMQAVKKAFDFIQAIISFVMPVVLLIIKTVWGNIKGVITGALDVIMGVVKVFTGLFTGDFKKMWEGVKQIFSGAITFVWNYIQLMFIGRILKAAAGFYALFRTGVASLWTAVKALFAGNISAVLSNARTGFNLIWGVVKSVFTNIVNFIRNTWSSAKTITSGAINFVKGLFTTGFSTMYRTVSSGLGNILSKFRNIFTTIRDFVSQRFGDIVNAAKALPGKIGQGIGSMASKVKSGVTSVINALARTLGKGVNGVIGGVNWVLGKIGVDSRVPKWDVPAYAQGTKSHPGGPALINDGTGTNSGGELVITKDGSAHMFKGKNVVANLPEGSQVLSAANTKKFLQSLPAYADGKGLLNKAWGAVKDFGGRVGSGIKKAKDWAGDAMDYVKNPSKLLDIALDFLGIKRPSGSEFIPAMARGGFNQVKEGAVDYVKGMLKKAETKLSASGISVTGGNGGGFGAPYRLTSRPGPRNTGIPGASRYHKGWDWAAPVGTPIPSVTDGVTTRNGWHPLSGNFVEVKDGSGIVHRYQHNSKNLVNVGDKVRKGQTIALVGATGVGSGPHLHYEVKKYADGGIVTQEQLAFVADGGFAESIISHDPSKRTSQRKIWEETGRQLGVDLQGQLNREMLDVLQRIADGVQSDRDIQMVMNERIIGQLVEKHVTEQRRLEDKRSRDFKGATR